MVFNHIFELVVIVHLPLGLIRHELICVVVLRPLSMHAMVGEVRADRTAAVQVILVHSFILHHICQKLN